MNYGPQGYYPQPKKSMGCFGYALIGGLCLFGGCAGLAVVGRMAGTRPAAAATEVPTSTQRSAPTPEPTTSQVESVTAAKLTADYDANEVAADNVWKRHRVDVTGTVVDISKGPLGGIHIALDSILGGVRVTVRKSEAGGAARLQKGQTVTLRGNVMGKVVGNVLVDSGEIL